MKQYKKRTLALILASAVTVVGAFGAENYKNSLMSLKFESAESGGVDVTLLTKHNYDKDINIIRKDANTYVLMLPETNSETKSSDYELGSGIQSVDVQTMPYTTSSSGYTKVTIKTQGNIALSAKTSIFLPPSKSSPDIDKEEQERINYERLKLEEEEERARKAAIEERLQQEALEQKKKQETADKTIQSSSGVSQTAPVDIKQSVKQFQPSNVNTTSAPQTKKAVDIKDLDNSDENKNKNKNELLYVIFGSIISLLLVAYFWFRAKGKMEEILGDRNDYNFDDEPKKEVKKKKPTINVAINNLDKKYSKPVKMPVNEMRQEKVSDSVDEIETEQEVHNVVDLDALLAKEQGNQPDSANIAESTDYEEGEEEENLALEEFLSTFNFDGDANNEVYEEPSEQFDEELYNKCLSNQNIRFSKSDVDALSKLMSVELDNDFLTDLRTNPEHVKAIQEEMEKQKAKTHKSSELLTLNVKDMLPDLSKALKKQGRKQIEYEGKAETVYFSEGYEVSTLKLNEALPDLSAELNNKKAYQSRPSDDVQYADNNYEVETMSIANELPNLADALKHPNKYNKPVEKKAKVNEKELLNNISNVTFKPFDDGSREFEVINEFEGGNAPSMDDMQKEFSQFDNEFEIVNEEEILPVEENDNDDFASLYSNEYVDLDSQNFETLEEITEDANTLIEDNNTIVELTPIKKEVSKDRKDSAAEELLKKIEEKEANKQEEALQVDIAEKQNYETAKEVVSQAPDFCILNGEEYPVVSSTYFTDKMGCHLAKKNNGYIIVGFVGDKTFNIKQYEKLDMEKLQSRKSERLDDGTQRYIIRIGIHKFIMNVKSDDMEFVMDLC